MFLRYDPPFPKMTQTFKSKREVGEFVSFSERDGRILKTLDLRESVQDGRTSTQTFPKRRCTLPKSALFVNGHTQSGLSKSRKGCFPHGSATVPDASSPSRRRVRCPLRTMWETTFPRITHAVFCKDFTTVAYTG